MFGILHRDLKPANVMLREDNSPVLIDFGLARRSVEIGTTSVGQVLGSPYYISPEQSQGLKVDARTDLYSLGVMFFEMLTGQRPYIGNSAMEIMEQHATAPVPRLPSHRRPAAGAGRPVDGEGPCPIATPRRMSCSPISGRSSPPSPEHVTRVTFARPPAAAYVKITAKL